MNLKEALNYRTKCLIHQKPLIPYCPSNNIIISKYGLHTVTDNKVIYNRNMLEYPKSNFDGINFLWDGTANCNNGSSIPFNNFNLTIYMRCYYCSGKNITYFPTLTDINSNQYYYTFLIKSGSENVFHSYLHNEVIMYVHNGKFYHMTANLLDGQVTCKMGSSLKIQSLDDLIKNTFSINLDFEMKKIENTSQLVDKIKFFNLFS